MSNRSEIYNLDRIIEHVPLFNSGGRRRLIAGTIVVLSIVVCTDVLRAFTAVDITSKRVSLPAIFAAGVIVIYGVGLVVELIGETIIARAVANMVAAFDFAWTHDFAWTRVIHNNKFWLIRIVYTAVFGTMLVIPYVVAICFESGKVFGIKHWRINLNDLSSEGKQAFDRLSPEARNAIESPLEKKGEFGRMALVTRFSTPDHRRWAQEMIEWPRNFLSTVSAISISLAVVTLTASPSMASAATIQVACAAITLFLYRAFFATLNATIVSLLEALALESPSIDN